MQKPLLGFLLVLTTPAAAQMADSLHVVVGTTVTAATRGYQPLWSVANRYGTIADRQADASTFVAFRNEHAFGKQRELRLDAPQGQRRGFYVGYGAALYNNNHFNSFILPEGYAKIGYRTWQLRAGRYREVTGEIDPSLSSGSLGISGNALPLPKVELAVTDYTNVPFTHGWVQFKGNFAHGWFGNQPPIDGAYLHQKSLYVRVGKKRLQGYGGLTHFAQWGGTFASGQAPSRFGDYLRIVLGRSGNGEDPVYQQGPVDIANAVGNHLLIPDFGLSFRYDSATIRLYTQTIFDKGIGDSLNTNQRDRLDGLKILGRDRLVGLSWETTRHSWLQKVLVEVLYTKYQGGPVIYQGRDNYYNNGTYIIGWQYQRRIIGTPLFLNTQNADNYQLGAAAYSWPVISNRVIAVHLGLKGTLTSKLKYRVLATHVRHYGNYYNTLYFATPKAQTSLLAEVPCQLGRFVATAAVASDFGDFGTNTAGILRLAYQLR
jgi:hypothetical protein